MISYNKILNPYHIMAVNHNRFFCNSQIQLATQFRASDGAIPHISQILQSKTTSKFDAIAKTQYTGKEPFVKNTIGCRWNGMCCVPCNVRCWIFRNGPFVKNTICYRWNDMCCNPCNACSWIFRNGYVSKKYNMDTLYIKKYI